MTYKVHIDGYNMLPYLSGEAKESPRENFFYISDDGDILAIRMGDWKVVLMEQRAKTLQCWFEPFVPLRAPKIFHLRRDPFERADENSNTYWDWIISHAYIIYMMQGVVAGPDRKTSRCSRHARSQPHSTSTPCCGHWRTRAAAPTTDHPLNETVPKPPYSAGAPGTARAERESIGGGSTNRHRRRTGAIIAPVSEASGGKGPS